MILTGKSLRIVVAIKPVDFRKGHDGLMAIVQSDLGLDPLRWLGLSEQIQVAL